MTCWHTVSRDLRVGEEPEFRTLRMQQNNGVKPWTQTWAVWRANTSPHQLSVKLRKQTVDSGSIKTGLDELQKCPSTNCWIITADYETVKLCQVNVTSSPPWTLNNATNCTFQIMIWFSWPTGGAAWSRTRCRRRESGVCLGSVFEKSGGKTGPGPTRIILT